MDFNWELYKNFYIVAKCESFSKAAEKLCITQPTVSYSIKQLESNLETKLFYRGTNGIKLTPEGEELFHYVEKSYNYLINGERNLKETKNLTHGRVSIGVQSHIGKFFLFQFVEQFHKNYPNIEINIISRNTEEMIECMENNEIDFMIDTSPIESIYTNLKIEPLMFLENCFISKEKISIEQLSLKDLNDYNLILPVKRSTPRKELNKVCEKVGVELKPFMTIETTEMLLDAVKKKMGVGYVIEESVKKEIMNNKIFKLNIKEKLPSLQLNIVYVDKYLTNVPKVFIKMIKQYYINDNK